MWLFDFFKQTYILVSCIYTGIKIMQYILDKHTE
jgi:hypothetical protein